MKRNSQPTPQQEAGQPKRTAGPKRPSHYTGHQKQRRSNWDQVKQTGEYIKVHKKQLLESVREPHPRAQLVRLALTQLSLRFKATPAISGYRTAAVLEPTGDEAPIVVSLESKIYLNNKRSRLIGSEGFRQRLLRRKGKLVLITPPRARAGVQEVAEYLKPMLTATARGSLDAYRIQCKHISAVHG
ncbi:hypothetical protein WJX82_007061 [Trebouxia sp. C0006]